MSAFCLKDLRWEVHRTLARKFDAVHKTTVTINSMIPSVRRANMLAGAITGRSKDMRMSSKEVRAFCPEVRVAGSA